MKVKDQHIKKEINNLLVIKPTATMIRSKGTNESTAVIGDHLRSVNISTHEVGNGIKVRAS